MPSFLAFFLLLCPTNAEPTFQLEKGNLPIFLVSGHGGSRPLADAPARVRANSADPHFSTSKDLVTAELTSLYSDELLRLTGERPSKLVSHIHRKYADLNRKEKWSSEVEAGRIFHRAFHAALQAELTRLVQKHGWVLLLDIHGQSSEPVDLIIGTRRGKTIGSWSKETLWGPQGLVQHLKQSGFSTLPDRPEDKVRFGGGFIVRTYGLKEKVEAWQLEHGKELRFEKTRNLRFVEVIAERLAREIRTHQNI